MQLSVIVIVIFIVTAMGIVIVMVIDKAIYIVNCINIRRHGHLNSFNLDLVLNCICQYLTDLV